MDDSVLGDLHGCYSCLKAALLQYNQPQRNGFYRSQPEIEFRVE